MRGAKSTPPASPWKGEVLSLARDCSVVILNEVKDPVDEGSCVGRDSSLALSGPKESKVGPDSLHSGRMLSAPTCQFSRSLLVVPLPKRVIAANHDVKRDREGEAPAKPWFRRRPEVRQEPHLP